MTATSPPQPETPAPLAERPRLLINGEPMRPEELGQMLSEAVLRRLRNPQAAPPLMTETLELPPVPMGGSRSPEHAARPAVPSKHIGALLWGGLLVLGLLLALYLLLR